MALIIHRIPRCLCGCGKIVKKRRKFISGHNSRIPEFSSHRAYGPLSDELKQKLSNIHKGRAKSEEHKANISKALKNRSFSEEHKRNISIAHKGKTLSEEHKAKIKKSSIGANNGFYGKQHSENTRQLLSKLRKNREIPKELKDHLQIVLTFKGRVHTKETKRKLSEIRKGRLNPCYSIIYTKEERKRFGSPKEKHPNWKGGVSFEPYAPEFTEDLKERIKRRDNYCCRNPNCKVAGVQFHIHHIDYNKKNSENQNLITLCISCHTKSNYNRNYWKTFYQNLTEENSNGFTNRSSAPQPKRTVRKRNT